MKEESPPVCESVQAGGESQTGQSDDPVLHALGVMTRVASAARDLLHESEEFDFPDGLGRGAPQRLWDALGSEIEAAENDGAPIDDVMPPADPALLASANRMLSDRLERVAHVLRGCGLPALADISGAEDLQMATAALSGAYQMALAENIAIKAMSGAIPSFDTKHQSHRATVIAASIHRRSENPIFGEGVTHVTIADEGAGAFLRLCQFDESQRSGEVVIDIDELDLIRDVGRKMIEELPSEKEWSDAW